MPNQNSITEIIEQYEFEIKSSRGNDFDYVFIEDENHYDQQKLLDLTIELVEPKSALYIEGTQGVLKKENEDIFLYKKDNKINTSNLVLNLFCVDQESINSLLSKEVHIEFNDDEELMKKHSYAYTEYLIARNLAHENFSNPESVVKKAKKELHNVLQQRSDVMIKGLLSSTHKTNYQVVGKDHLDEYWHEKFEQKNYAVIGKKTEK